MTFPRLEYCDIADNTRESPESWHIPLKQLSAPRLVFGAGNGIFLHAQNPRISPKGSAMWSKTMTVPYSGPI